MSERKRVPTDIEASVLIMCRRRCCICFGLSRDVTLKQGQVAHLDRNPANVNLDNLVFLCLEHHDEYDSRTSQSKGVTAAEVRQFRIELHEVIDRAWKEPVRLADVHVRAGDSVTGHYVREGEFDSAELDIENLGNGRVKVSGLALWGKTRPYGPNLGELDFEGDLRDAKVQYVYRLGDDNYCLDLTFLGDALSMSMGTCPWGRS